MCSTEVTWFPTYHLVEKPCHVACEPPREYLSLDASDGYSASDVATAVTCPRCMGTPAFQEMVKALFPAYHRELQAKKSNVTVGDCGCKK